MSDNLLVGVIVVLPIITFIIGLEFGRLYRLVDTIKSKLADRFDYSDTINRHKSMILDPDDPVIMARMEYEDKMRRMNQ